LNRRLKLKSQRVVLEIQTTRNISTAPHPPSTHRDVVDFKKNRNQAPA